MEHISWIGVLLGAVTLFVLGGLWFTALFGAAYREELGVPASADGGTPVPPRPEFAKALAGQFLAGLFIAAALAWLIGDGSASHGAKVGAVGGLLVAAALTQLHQFEGKSPRHLLITASYMVVGLTLVGTVVGAFQA
ncbi:MAG: DUF1761 domain-containing protein [Nocardioidaceae bacterium]